jgi:PAS domain S-box-containing protein
MFGLPVALHFVAGFDGYFKKLAPSWGELLGYSMEELLAQPYLAFVHPEDVERTRAEAVRYVEGYPTTLFENRYLHRDGTYRWLLWASAAVHEEQCICGVALDYTPRKLGELALGEALAEKSRLLGELHASTQTIQALQKGLVKVCAWTKQVQHEGRWMPPEEFLSNHLHINVSHGISEAAREKFVEDLRSVRLE